VDPERGVLVFRNRHETDSRRWVVDELDLRSRSTHRLFESATFSLAPHVWPGGGVALNPEQRGLTLLGSKDRVSCPLGLGVDVLEASDAQGRFVAVLHTPAGELGTPLVLDRATGQSWRLAVPDGEQIAIAGFARTAEETP
jgi:hypothetical protein